MKTKILPIIFIALVWMSGCSPAIGAGTALGVNSDQNQESLITALHDAINSQQLVPDFARFELVPIQNRPTLAFPENQGLVIKINIFGYPDPKGTDRLVGPLVEVTAEVAERQQVSLNGLEIVFHRRQNNNPMQVWAARPPWQREDTFLHRPSAHS